MKYREARPSAHLTDIIDRFWSIEHEGTHDASPEPVLPDGCPEIVFNLADRFQRIPLYGDIETQATVIVSGQLRKRILIRPTGRVSLFGVRFRPHAGSMFLSVSMHELTDRVVPLSSVIGLRSDELESHISDADGFERRVSILESALTSRLGSGNGDSYLARALTGIVARTAGGLSVRELAKRSGIGERRIERIFARHVGVSPKTFSRIVRFAGSIRSLEAAIEFDLLDTALIFGYFDQSHMIRDFNEFAGTSPLKYFEQTHRLSELFTS